MNYRVGVLVSFVVVLGLCSTILLAQDSSLSKSLETPLALLGTAIVGYFISYLKGRSKDKENALRNEEYETSTKDLRAHLNMLKSRVETEEKNKKECQIELKRMTRKWSDMQAYSEALRAVLGESGELLDASGEMKKWIPEKPEKSDVISRISGKSSGGSSESS